MPWSAPPSFAYKLGVGFGCCSYKVIVCEEREMGEQHQRETGGVAAMAQWLTNLSSIPEGI